MAGMLKLKGRRKYLQTQSALRLILPYYRCVNNRLFTLQKVIEYKEINLSRQVF